MRKLFNRLLLPKKLPVLNQKNDFHKRVGTNYWQRLSRFYVFRKTYSILQTQIQKLNPTAYTKRLEILDKSMFTGVQVIQAVKELEDCAVCFGLRLPDHMVKEIYDFAIQSPCTEPGYNEEFLVEDVNNGRLQSGHYVMRGLVSNVRDCQAIEKIVHDPLLLEIVHKYLKYWPTLITQHLTWSFASNLPEAKIKKIYPPTNFHYDIAGYNFMTVYFYITDVDVDSGPHIMIINSHKRKPLWMLLASNCQSDHTVLNHYGTKNQIVIIGKSGFGFIQDPSCIHKVKPPVTSNRLLLQIRYS
ncbi:MAG: hypothetical protein AB3A66_20900 [Nodularia sp. CChRGM 3473]